MYSDKFIHKYLLFFGVEICPKFEADDGCPGSGVDRSASGAAKSDEMRV
jgi:hypothetical protein